MLSRDLSSSVCRAFAIAGVLCVFAHGICPPGAFAQGELSADESKRNQGLETYNQAVEHYKKGEYSQARHLFSHITKHAPTYAPAFYQLGNTCLKMGKLNEAKTAYTECSRLTKDVITQKNCQVALQHIGSMANKQATKAVNEARKAAEDVAMSARDAERMKRYNDQVAELEKRKTEIMSEAEGRAHKILMDAEKRLREIEANTNQRVRVVATGERKLGLTSAQRTEIMAPAEAEAEHIRDIARQRAKGIQMPSPPILEGKAPESKAAD